MGSSPPPPALGEPVLLQLQASQSLSAGLDN